MKRILNILAQRPGRTGSGIFLNSLVDAGFKKHYTQAVIAGIPEDEELNFPLIEDRYLYPVYFGTDSVPFPVVGMSDVMPYQSTRYKDMSSEMLKAWKKAFSRRIKEAVEDFQPDVIFSHHLWLLTSLTKKLYPEIPLIAIAHGTGLRQLELAYRLAEEVIQGCQAIDHVLALNLYQKKQISLKYGIPEERITITGCGYNSEIFYPVKAEKKKDTVKLVYCGKLSAAKGVPHLLRSFMDISSSQPDLELVLVGSGFGTEEKIINDLAAKKPEKIYFKGAVPQEELGNIFRECDIFVLPSFYEGFGLVVLEALASGLLVVCTDLPGLREAVGGEINVSGLIQYVPLPRLKDQDQPWIEDIPKFELDLKQSILEMISYLSSDYKKEPGILTNIQKYSWENLFSRIEELIDH